MTDREEFEVWMRTGELDLTPDLERDGDVYEDWDTQRAWRGWKAARATAEQSRDSVIEECMAACYAFRIPFPSDRDDRIRNIANEDCWNAIRALKSQQDAAIESKPAEPSMDSVDAARWRIIHATLPDDELGELATTVASDNGLRSTSIFGKSAVELIDAAIESQRSGDGS